MPTRSFIRSSARSSTSCSRRLFAYPLSLKNLPGRKGWNFYVFFTMLFSGGLIPSYMMWSTTFHIKDTVFAQIVPTLLMSAMNVLAGAHLLCDLDPRRAL